MSEGTPLSFEQRLEALERVAPDVGLRLELGARRVDQMEKREAAVALEHDRRLTALEQRLAKLEGRESHYWTVATDCDSRLTHLESRVVRVEHPLFVLSKGASDPVPASWLDEELALRCDAMKGENELLRKKLARKTRELSEMASAYANTKLAAGNRLARIEVLEAEVRQLREMNEAHLRRIERLDKGNGNLLREMAGKDRIVQNLSAQRDRAEADLAEAREKGLSLGNAALRKGWGDCEKAVAAWLLRLRVGAWEEGDHKEATGYDWLIGEIRMGAHHPADFNAHASAWTGADEGDSVQVPVGGPLQDWQRAALGNPIGSIRYPASPPEAEIRLEIEAGAEPAVRLINLKPLRELAGMARGHIHSSYVLLKLREAGVISGEEAP